ncbi:dynamin family protein [Rothia sp. (in: high G+C Gram-positive bacteria)]|uniref:dynamin family protein n=1 Tax=Rothia sp. (in: high G+C Gram-positive bacteria) TaxID=1885016 RepID=UPI003216757B
MAETKKDQSHTALALRVAALEKVVELGADRLEPELLHRATDVLARTGARRELSAEHTVIGFFGATGSGKSTLFNAVVGKEIAKSAARRPTTSVAQAAVWGKAGVEPLLDWLGVENRTYMDEDATEATEALNRADVPVTVGMWNKIRKSVGHAKTEEATGGLVLLDLPDFDSVEASNRVIVEKMAQCVDVLVWVMDPQKYADAVIHQDFIAPLASHGAVTLAVLNQVDRLDPAEVPAVLDSLKLLLAQDGLSSTLVAAPLAVSARTGEGVPRLREVLGQVAVAKNAALERIDADLRTVGADLGRQDGGGHPRGITLENTEQLEAGLYAASGADGIVKAAANSYKLHAAEKTGWIATRWLLKARKDPLKRLGLHKEHDGAPISKSSLPPLGASQKAAMSTSLRTFAGDVSEGVNEPWSHSIRDSARTYEDQLPSEIERAIATVHYDAGKKRWWWQVLNVFQWLGIVAALVGLLWLTGLALATYFQIVLPEPPTVEGFPLPVPTLLVITGLLLGIVIAMLGRLVAAAGHRMYARGITRQLKSNVADVAQRAVVAPVEDELNRLADYRAALEQAR